MPKALFHLSVYPQQNLLRWHLRSVVRSFHLHMKTYQYLYGREHSVPAPVLLLLKYFSLKLVYEGDTLVDKKLIIAGKEQKAE